MRIPILRKLDATVEIDPILVAMDHELESLGAGVDAIEADKKPEALALLEQARAERDAYAGAKDAKPRVRVRALPPDALAKIKGTILRDPAPSSFEAPGALAEAVSRTRNLNREICRWGVVAWEIAISGEKVQFAKAGADLAGRLYEIASDESIDFLELNNLLDPVALAAWRFSVLQEDDRKK